MGRFGGHELSYGSDADVMFVHEPLEGVDGHEASTAATHVANELRRLLALPGTDPALDIDTGLRPEGKQGPLVRSLDSYAAYYAKWSAVWEAQALLRADALVGDRGLRDRFTAMADPLRFPADGITDKDVREVRRIKARVDSSGCRAAPTRPPTSSSAAAAWPTWSGPSSCSRCGTPGRSSRCAPPARWTRWPPRSRRTCCRRRTPTRCGRPGRRRAGCATRSCSCADGRRTRCRATAEKAAVAHLCGYAPGESDELVNDYLRITRRAGRGRPGLLGLTGGPRASPRPVSRTRRRDVGADLGGGTSRREGVTPPSPQRGRPGQR